MIRKNGVRIERPVLSLADSALLEEIDLKFEKVIQNPSFYLARHNAIFSALKNTGDVFSWWMSNPDLREGLYRETGTTNSREIRSLAKEGITNVREAWSYIRGISDALNDTTDNILTNSRLCTIASIIEPKNSWFRESNKEARIFYPDYQTPSGFQVEAIVNDLTDNLKIEGVHPINKAIYAHLNLVAIQPWEHANKRVARLVQNSILFDYNFPPAIVSPAERIVYRDFLKEGLLGLQDSNADKQRGFYNFLAGKVNYALDKVLDDLDPFKSKSK